ncbi:AAA family ATPase [Aureimonas jatrophae]|uniref:Dephospho-CoA kinase n=1 Tax=Aureimonas jatrophae TaxID=1166073 RepID=A0A1H0IUM5_9HYPH|nr:AAA family ATPase [Aureimonas jatrophae]MBB3952365.1 dephospho-CoA kinase [Aureimonas jatrophae]SDO34930.1 Dephospho-CoA kinase [Aureimonas jatrophae]
MAPTLILAFSGGIGSGKSDLTIEVARRLGWGRASFGAHVKKVARDNHRDPEDRAVLQSLGQALVVTNLDAFVRETLAQAGDAQSVVVDGVRHVEVLMKLRALQGTQVRLVHIDTPSDIRHERHMKRDNVERRLIARYESDITEAQLPRILPQYADKTINGSLPTSILADEVETFARAVHRTIVAEAA